jgi:hypothetical protein
MKAAFALCIISGIFLSSSCNSDSAKTNEEEDTVFLVNPSMDGIQKSIQNIAQIPLPIGSTRIVLKSNSFAAWVRDLPLKKNNTIYLYNGQAKANQREHYAVVDISTGNQNLQQCADALMRLRAEYLYSIHAYDRINFKTGNGKELSFARYARGERYALLRQQLSAHTINTPPCYTHNCLTQFLNVVFNYCSTYSLEVMCKPKEISDGIMPGDMFVKAGSPGHAMMVADVAVNAQTGKRIYLLLQGFMPAQDIHIVRNPSNTMLSPWYEESNDRDVETSGWTFKPTDLKTWP